MIPDTYSVPIKNVVRVTTNTRYPHFKQIHFTAGDEEQFTRSTYQPCRKTNVEYPVPTLSPLLQMNEQAMVNTFRYLFYKFKKGLFVQIRNGRVVLFLPFSNVYYRNEWSHSIHKSSAPPNALPIHHWYSNNGIMRYENPCNETDTGMCHLRHMFETLCARRRVPDVDLFVNKRDFPLLTDNHTEPYDNIWGNGIDLQSHRYDAYTPILGMNGRSGYLDLAIPTCEDWNRVMFKRGVHFAQTSHILPLEEVFVGDWKNKKRQFVFRGSSTGIGTSAQTNPRLKLVKKYCTHPLFNVGITKNSDRVRKVKGSSMLQTPQIVPTTTPLSFAEQSAFKYIIHVPGHTQAYRLVIELAMNVVILLVDGAHHMWIEEYMKPWEHYVPVAADLSDLDHRVEWCLNHEEECSLIAVRARELYEQRCLTDEQLLDELLRTVVRVHANCVQEESVVSPPFVVPPIIEKPPVIQKQCNGRQWKDLVHHPLNANPNKLRIIRKIQLSSTSYLATRVDGWSCVVLEYHPIAYTIGRTIFNSLIRYVPNFAFTFYSHPSNPIIIQESVPGVALSDWMKSSAFNIPDWIDIFAQCCGALAVAQNKYMVSLYNCNVRLTPRAHNHVIDYSVDIGLVARVSNPRWVPVFVSYDDAIGVDRNIRLDRKMREFHPSVDVKSLLGICVPYLRDTIFEPLTRFVFGEDITSVRLNKGYYLLDGGPTPHQVLHFLIHHFPSKQVAWVKYWEFHHTGIRTTSTPMFSCSSHPVLDQYKYKLMNLPYTKNIDTHVQMSLPLLTSDHASIVPLPLHYRVFASTLLDLINSDIPSEGLRKQLIQQYKALTRYPHTFLQLCQRPSFRKT
jgi:hypothetical protein